MSLLISTRTFDIPAEWHETVEYIASITPKEMHIEDIRVVENLPKKNNEPSYYIEFDLTNTESQAPYTITRKYNALQARRYVESLEKH